MFSENLFSFSFFFFGGFAELARKNPSGTVSTRAKRVLPRNVLLKKTWISKKKKSFFKRRLELKSQRPSHGTRRADQLQRRRLRGSRVSVNVCACVRACLFVSVCMYLCVFGRACMQSCMYGCVRERVCVRVCRCVCVCLRASKCVFSHLCVGVHT